MKIQVITHNSVEGFHYYPNAPAFCSYLGDKHRHIFEIRCWSIVSHKEREIEINKMQNEIQNILQEKFGTPCDFLDMSCESIAAVILGLFKSINKVEILEDGYGGAVVSR